MSFNDNADLDTSQVEGGGGGGGMFGGGMPGGGIAVGGGAGGILLLILYFVFGGLSDSGGGSTSPGQLQQGQVQAGGSQGSDFSQCRTGADANRDAQCRVIGTVNSVQAYWATELPRHGTSLLPRQHRPLQRQHAVPLRHGVQPGRPVLLPPGPQGLHRRQLLQRADLPLRCRRRRAGPGVRRRARVRAPRPGPARRPRRGAVRPAGGRERRRPGGAHGRLPRRGLGEARHRDQGRPGRRVPQAADPEGHRLRPVGGLRRGRRPDPARGPGPGHPGVVDARVAARSASGGSRPATRAAPSTPATP